MLRIPLTLEFKEKDRDGKKPKEGLIRERGVMGNRSRGFGYTDDVGEWDSYISIAQPQQN